MFFFSSSAKFFLFNIFLSDIKNLKFHLWKSMFCVCVCVYVFWALKKFSTQQRSSLDNIIGIKFVDFGVYCSKASFKPALCVSCCGCVIRVFHAQFKYQVDKSFLVLGLQLIVENREEKNVGNLNIRLPKL